MQVVAVWCVLVVSTQRAMSDFQHLSAFFIRPCTCRRLPPDSVIFKIAI